MHKLASTKNGIRDKRVLSVGHKVELSNDHGWSSRLPADTVDAYIQSPCSNFAV